MTSLTSCSVWNSACGTTPSLQWRHLSRLDRGRRDGYGDTLVELLCDINQETRSLPASAVAGTIVAPSGDHSEGVDSEVELLVHEHSSRHVGSPSGAPERGVQVQCGGTDGRASWNVPCPLGYETRASNALILLADVVRKQELDDGVEVNLAEVGGRYRLTPYAILSAAVGAGFGDDSPEVRTAGGLQVQF